MIRNSLLWKMTLAFMLVAVLATAIVALFIRMTSVDRLNRLLVDQQRNSLETLLIDYYTTNGSWADIEANWQELRMLSAPFPVASANDRFSRTPGPDGHGVEPGFDRRRLFGFGLADSQGRVLVQVDPQYPPGSTVPRPVLKRGADVVVGGQTVGTILVMQSAPRLNPEETLFLERMNSALIFAVLGAMLVALIFGLFLAQSLIRPLHALTSAAQRIAQGQLEQQVEVGSKDEVGQLAEAFNRMSQEVARVNHQRKQMTADIAHDLRTPLTVIGGYVESMRDGVLQPTPERLTLIYTEIERLQNLVGDLKMLSQVDAGELPLHPQDIDPKSLLVNGAAPFQHRAEQQGITLTIDADDDLPVVRVDSGRMMQVFSNLISNALRYTASGGTIILSARASDGRVLLSVADTGSGIEADELPFIFERFHRADKSRHSESGESGLGLAIVRALIEAHAGSVRATSRLGEGTEIQISLPAAPINSIQRKAPAH